MGPDAMILVFWKLSFKPAFSLSYFTFIKRLFSSSLLSALRVVSSAYLRLLIFLNTILIPAWASSSPAFHMMYSAYKLNKQGDNANGRKGRGTNELLDEGERVEWKNWLKTQHSNSEDHGIQSHHFMANKWGQNGNSDQLYFLGLQNHCRQWL